MPINILDQNTINKIAAGEVVDRPSSVVKELVENAIDAGATAVTIEIKDGGTTLIRITDNGCGINSSEVRTAFLRHSTSKIKDATDLACISSLGFRGEALSSISAVAQVELITKTSDSLTAVRYEIEGGKEKAFEEIGAPDGTTFLVRNLFFNTPARRKFLKTAVTEAGYISALVEHLCMSRPDISFRLINNGKALIQTSGNGNLKDVIYTVYGREIASNLTEINKIYNDFSISGYVGKPIISRGNRNFENYYINGRYIKSNIIYRGIEDAYASYMMQHKYPFTALNININPELLDVNVHPSKMELRFSNGQEIYECIKESISDALSHKELIPEITIDEPIKKIDVPINEIKKTDVMDIGINDTKKEQPIIKNEKNTPVSQRMPEPFETKRNEIYIQETKPVKYEQLEITRPELLMERNKKSIKIIGQVFDTYWIIEFENNMYIVDQHAAHEKVLFERFMKRHNENSITTQQLSPPVIFTLTLAEKDIYNANEEYFNSMGFEIEDFGGDEYALRGIPAEFTEANPSELLMEILDSLSEDNKKSTPDSIRDRIATMSCKAAVKGNNKLSYSEASELLNELMNLENPYNCPHGRPTMITMSKYELEKKFKRIL